VEVAWAIFAGACVLAIFAVSRWETIPFHFVWVSLTLLYGFRVWRTTTTAAVLGAVMAATGVALVWTVVQGNRAADEVSEVPLMAAMFVVMAWHAQRRQRAVDSAEQAAVSERKARDRQREFVRDASHELRTPITVARGHAELARATAQDPRTERDMEVILDELDRLSRLSDRLLVLAAADHPDFLARQELQVRPFVQDRARRWAQTAPRAWETAIGADGSVPADRDRLATAVDALVENAVDATEDGDRIRIGAAAEGAMLVIEVADAGKGIDAQLLPHLFERFWRPQEDRGRGSGGTGLGLAIVRAIAEAHGGTAEVSSSSGEGSVFRLRLPHFTPATRAAALDLPARRSPDRPPLPSAPSSSGSLSPVVDGSP
jgi:signal transduction histidine kinase